MPWAGDKLDWFLSCVQDCISCLALGASAASHSAEGRLPIHYAAISGNLGTIELVLQNSGEVRPDASHHAGKPKCADPRRCARSAQVNAVDEENGWTALHCVAAASPGWQADELELAAGTARCLLLKGADRSLLDLNGRTAMALAEETGNAQVAQLLKDDAEGGGESGRTFAVPFVPRGSAASAEL